MVLVMVTMQLSTEQRAKLKRISRRTGQSMAAVVHSLVNAADEKTLSARDSE